MPMLGANCADGPGGRDCHCCGQPPGRARRRARRSARRRERQTWRREIRETTDGTSSASVVPDAITMS